MIVIGDSHVEGLAPHLPGIWTLSHRGWSTSKFFENMPEIPASDQIVIVLGTNDHKSTERGIATGMVGIVKRIQKQQPKTRITWVGPPSVVSGSLASLLEDVIEIEQRVSGKLGIRWIDSRPFTTSGHQPDGIHLTSKGYRIFASGLMAALSGKGPVGVLPVLGILAALGTAFYLLVSGDERNKG